MTGTSAYIRYTDDALLSLWKNGDKGAFAYFFERSFHKLTTTAFQRIKDWHQAEELAQDALYSLYKASSHLTNNPMVYCKNILKKRIINIYRTQKLSLLQSSEIKEESLQIADNYIEYKELEKKIGEHIESLPGQSRKVFLLKREENLNNQEVSQHLGISIKTVETYMAKALRILKKKLEYYVLLGIIIGIQNYNQ